MRYNLLYPLAFAVLLLIMPCYASAVQRDYYADIEATLDAAGRASFAGETNYPGLSDSLSHSYTSKKGIYWLFNLTKQEAFSNYFITIKLPEGASINYVRCSGDFTISNVDGRLSVKAFGEDEILSVVIQYQLMDKNDQYIGYLILLIIPIIGITGFFLIRRRSRQDKGRNKGWAEDTSVDETDPAAFEYNISGLTARQKKIVSFLVKKGKPAAQSEIERSLGLPKSSVSRNIKTLELRGLVEKEKAGMTNLIKLKRNSE